MSDKYDPFQKAWDLKEEAHDVKTFSQAEKCFKRIKSMYFNATDANIKSTLLAAASIIAMKFSQFEKSVSEFEINNHA